MQMTATIENLAQAELESLLVSIGVSEPYGAQVAAGMATLVGSTTSIPTEFTTDAIPTPSNSAEVLIEAHVGNPVGGPVTFINTDVLPHLVAFYALSDSTHLAYVTGDRNVTTWLGGSGSPGIIGNEGTMEMADTGHDTVNMITSYTHLFLSGIGQGNGGHYNVNIPSTATNEIIGVSESPKHINLNNAAPSTEIGFADGSGNAKITENGNTTTIKFADTGQLANITGETHVVFGNGFSFIANDPAHIAAIQNAHTFG
jgi:hypothetical protein